MTEATASKETIAAPRKARRASPNLRLVSPVNLPEMERVLTEAASQMAPMIKRSELARQAAIAEVRALKGERDAVVARRDLMDRLVEAMNRAFDAELADIDTAIDGKLNGIGVREPSPSDD